MSVMGLIFSCLQWEPVQYFNNKIICDLVEEKFKGIISILVRRHSAPRRCSIRFEITKTLFIKFIFKSGFFFYAKMQLNNLQQDKVLY